MDPISIMLVIGSVFGSMISLWQGIETRRQSQENFDKQMNFSESEAERNQQNVETEWQRQDTAFQRQTQDAVNAGLSPLAVTGGSDSNSQFASPSMPNLPNLQNPMGNFSASALLSQLGDYQEKNQRSKLLQSQTSGQDISNLIDSIDALMQSEKANVWKSLSQSEKEKFLKALLYNETVGETESTTDLNLARGIEANANADLSTSQSVTEDTLRPYRKNLISAQVNNIYVETQSIFAQMSKWSAEMSKMSSDIKSNEALNTKRAIETFVQQGKLDELAMKLEVLRASQQANLLDAESKSQVANMMKKYNKFIELGKKLHLFGSKEYTSFSLGPFGFSTGNSYE